MIVRCAGIYSHTYVRTYIHIYICMYGHRVEVESYQRWNKAFQRFISINQGGTRDGTIFMTKIIEEVLYDVDGYVRCCSFGHLYEFMSTFVYIMINY